MLFIPVHYQCMHQHWKGFEFETNKQTTKQTNKQTSKQAKQTHCAWEQERDGVGRVVAQRGQALKQRETNSSREIVVNFSCSSHRCPCKCSFRKFHDLFGVHLFLCMCHALIASQGWRKAVETANSRCWNCTECAPQSQSISLQMFASFCDCSWPLATLRWTVTVKNTSWTSTRSIWIKPRRLLTCLRSCHQLWWDRDQVQWSLALLYETSACSIHPIMKRRRSLPVPAPRSA